MPEFIYRLGREERREEDERRGEREGSRMTGKAHFLGMHSSIAASELSRFSPDYLDICKFRYLRISVSFEV